MAPRQHAIIEFAAATAALLAFPIIQIYHGVSYVVTQLPLFHTEKATARKDKVAMETMNSERSTLERRVTVSHDEMQQLRAQAKLHLEHGERDQALQISRELTQRSKRTQMVETALRHLNDSMDALDTHIVAGDVVKAQKKVANVLRKTGYKNLVADVEDMRSDMEDMTDDMKDVQDAMAVGTADDDGSDMLSQIEDEFLDEQLADDTMRTDTPEPPTPRHIDVSDFDDARRNQNFSARRTQPLTTARCSQPSSSATPRQSDAPQKFYLTPPQAADEAMTTVIEEEPTEPTETQRLLAAS